MIDVMDSVGYERRTMGGGSILNAVWQNKMVTALLTFPVIIIVKRAI